MFYDVRYRAQHRLNERNTVFISIHCVLWMPTDHVSVRFRASVSFSRSRNTLKVSNACLRHIGRYLRCLVVYIWNANTTFTVHDIGRQKCFWSEFRTRGMRRHLAGFQFGRSLSFAAVVELIIWLRTLHLRASQRCMRY